MAARNQQAVQEYLLARDKALAVVIENTLYPGIKISRKSPPDVYLSLLHSIVSQQLSVKAANTIYERLLKLFKNGYPHPRLLAGMPLQKLRNAGLSQQKAGYVKNVAVFALNQGIAYESLRKLSDAQVIEYLTQIKGVGRWTAEMILMFALNRRDVFSVDDLGIQSVMTQLYNLDARGAALKNQMLQIAEQWRPYRSIVCKYMWRWKTAE